MNLIFKIFWLCPLIVICFGDFHLKSTADRDLTEEINAFDSLLGRYLNIYQQNQWNSLIFGHHSLIDRSNVQKLRQKFIQNLSNWSSNRLRRNCIGRNGQNQENCRYLSEIQRVFGGGSNNDNSMRQFTHMKQLLTKKIEQIEFTDHNDHGKEYRCDESMDSLMETRDDPQELMNIWQNCHQQLGQWPIPELFMKIHQLMVNGDHFKEFWNHMNADLRLGTIDQIHSKALNVWNRLKSFYDLLIDYIGHRLRAKYLKIDGQFDADRIEMIPAHWLRSLNGGQMDSIIDLVLPYKEMDHDHRSNSNTIKIVTDFYVKHAGFSPLPGKFWQNSNLRSHPNGSCYPCTMNMYDHDDIRMNICLETNNNRYNLRRLFHEIGHVYYYLQSSRHRNLYQMTTNSAIHESIGEMMRLSYEGCRLNRMKNFVHLKRYEQLKVNALIIEALSSFVMLPYALVLEQWRRQTFSTENMTIHESNKLYWHLRREIQRIEQPISEDNDDHRILDPLLKHHAANFQSYWRYYFGIIVQHRFYQRLCENQSSSLIDCCPSNFELLREFLTIDLMHPNHDDQIVIEQMFSSQNDPINSYDAEPIINYYRPLIDWLTRWKLNLMNLK